MRAVAALWAMIMTKHEAATGSSASVSLQLTFGHLNDGSPPGTGPMTAKPRSARLSQALAAIEPTTRTSGAGKRGANRRARRMLAATKIDKATTRPSADGAARTTSQSWTDGMAGGDGDPEHVAEHRDADLHPDPGQEPDQHRARQEIGEEAGLEEAREQKQARRLQRQHADQRHVPVAAERRHVGERAGEDRSGGRISRHHQVARRAEDGEGDEGQENGVKAGDDGRPGDAGVAEHLRNVHRGERHAGESVAQRLARPDRKNAAENAEPRSARPCAPASPTVGVNSPFPAQAS